MQSGWRRGRNRLGEQARAQGFQPAGGLWESYVVGPESSPDPMTWRTELNQPLLR